MALLSVGSKLAKTTRVQVGAARKEDAREEAGSLEGGMDGVLTRIGVRRHGNKKEAATCGRCCCVSLVHSCARTLYVRALERNLHLWYFCTAPALVSKRSRRTSTGTRVSTFVRRVSLVLVVAMCRSTCRFCFRARGTRPAVLSRSPPPRRRPCSAPAAPIADTRQLADLDCAMACAQQFRALLATRPARDKRMSVRALSARQTSQHSADSRHGGNKGGATDAVDELAAEDKPRDHVLLARVRALALAQHAPRPALLLLFREALEDVS